MLLQAVTARLPVFAWCANVIVHPWVTTALKREVSPIAGQPDSAAGPWPSAPKVTRSLFILPTIGRPSSRTAKLASRPAWKRFALPLVAGSELSPPACTTPPRSIPVTKSFAEGGKLVDAAVTLMLRSRSPSCPSAVRNGV